MSSLRLHLAGEQDLALLLSMMEPFNALEQTPWDPIAKKRALGTLLADVRLGVVGLLFLSKPL